MSLTVHSLLLNRHIRDFLQSFIFILFTCTILMIQQQLRHLESDVIVSHNHRRTRSFISAVNSLWRRLGMKWKDMLSPKSKCICYFDYYFRFRICFLLTATYCRVIERLIPWGRLRATIFFALCTLFLFFMTSTVNDRLAFSWMENSRTVCFSWKKPPNYLYKHSPDTLF